MNNTISLTRLQQRTDLSLLKRNRRYFLLCESPWSQLTCGGVSHPPGSPHSAMLCLRSSRAGESTPPAFWPPLSSAPTAPGLALQSSPPWPQVGRRLEGTDQRTISHPTKWCSGVEAGGKEEAGGQLWLQHLSSGLTTAHTEALPLRKWPADGKKWINSPYLLCFHAQLCFSH